MKDCPNCKTKDSIEAGFMLELDNVVLEREGDDRWWTVVDGTPGTSCRFPEIGVEPLESSNTYIQCRHCGESFEATGVARDLMARWTYTPTDEREGIATVVREALEGDSNDAEHDALIEVAQHLGIDYTIPED